MIDIRHGDCLEVMATLPESSVDSVVTDPPYHLTSIVKRFGKEGSAPAKSNGATGVFGRASAGFMGKVWDGGDIAFDPATWAAMLRVLKPGGYLVAFASTRGYHRMVCAVEDAGFIIHPMIGWIFASGFPKAHRIDAEGWEGWRYGLQAMKPALEPICLAQKPMSEKTGTANVLRHGTGALNVDGCRVATGDEGSRAGGRRPHTHDGYQRPNATMYQDKTDWSMDTAGRWPPNLAHDGSDEVLEAFPIAPGQQGRLNGNEPSTKTRDVFGNFAGRSPSEPRNDTGTAARFFYCAKASAAERAGSKHPTIKPLALMRWLTRLITPSGGTVLDPFAGSGTTGEAATLEGFDAILIEREAEYVADIRKRLERRDLPLFTTPVQPSGT